MSQCLWEGRDTLMWTASERHVRLSQMKSEHFPLGLFGPRYMDSWTASSFTSSAAHLTP